VTWNRAAVAQALQFAFTNATEGAVKVHERPPEVVNPPAVVIGRPVQVTYSTFALSVDEASLPVTVVGGIETEDATEALKETCRTAVLADATLGGAVQNCYPAEERNWRNLTGAGGIQLLLVDLILTVTM
jgi:hypothetical protein